MLKGEFNIYGTTADGKIDYSKHIKTIPNTILWTGINFLQNEWITDGDSLRPASGLLNGETMLCLGTGTTANSIWFTPSGTPGYSDPLMVNAVPATSIINTEVTYDPLTLTARKNFFVPTAGTYTEIGVIGYGGWFPGQKGFGLSRALDTFTIPPGGGYVIYSISFNNTVYNDFIIQGKNDTTSRLRNIYSMLAGSKIEAPNTAHLGIGTNALNDADTLMGNGVISTGLAYETINKLGNGTGPNGLTDATKIITAKIMRASFTDVPPGTYTEFGVGYGGNYAFMRQLKNRVITSTPNVVTISTQFLVTE